MRSLGDRVIEETDVGQRVWPLCLGEERRPVRELHEIENPTQPLIGDDELASMMIEVGLTTDDADVLLRLKLPAVGLVGTGGCSEGPVGASRLGGRPDVPRDWSWPHRAGYPQGLVAQLNLTALNRMPGCDVLPSSGHLVFFYGFFDHGETGEDCWTVQWIEPDQDLHRADYPVWPEMPFGIPEVHSPSPVRFFSMWSFPSADSRAIPMGSILDEDRMYEFEAKYRDAIGERLGDWWPAHQLLGYPLGAFQRDPETRYLAEQSQSGVASAIDMTAGVRSLFQADRDGWSTDFIWSSVGAIVFFMIPPDALADRDFTRVWLDIQS